MVRRLLFWTLVVAFIWLVVSQRLALEQLGRTLGQGRPGWIALAVGLIAVYNLGFALSYQTAFQAAGVRLPYWGLMAAMLAALCVGATAPGGSAAGLALFVDDVARRGHSAARAAVGLWLQLITDFTTLTIVGGVGLAIVLLREQANAFALAGVGGLAVITLSLLAALVLGGRHPDGLRRLLEALRRLANLPSRALTALGRPTGKLLAVDWPERSTHEFSAAAGSARRSPLLLLFGLGVMLLVNLADLLTFVALFHAFNFSIETGALMAGFALMALAIAASPAPHGAGVVEATLLAVFAGLGVPWPVNLAVSLSYRGLSFWLPTGIGFLLLRRLKLFAGEAR